MVRPENRIRIGFLMSYIITIIVSKLGTTLSRTQLNLCRDDKFPQLILCYQNYIIDVVPNFRDTLMTSNKAFNSPHNRERKKQSSSKTKAI